MISGSTLREELALEDGCICSRGFRYQSAHLASRLEVVMKAAGSPCLDYVGRAGRKQWRICSGKATAWEDMRIKGDQERAWGDEGDFGQRYGRSSRYGTFWTCNM